MNPCRALRNNFSFFAACLLFSSTAIAQDPARQPVSVDLLVKGATIVTMASNRRVLENGFLAARGDEIVAIGQDVAAAFPKGLAAKQTIDATGKLIIPGLINGHTHIPMVLMRGLKDDVTLDDWLRKFIFPAEARNVTEDYVRWGSRLALAQIIPTPTTPLATTSYFQDAEAEETKAAGLRGV